MKISSLYCSCDGRIHPANHYTSGACPNPPAPLPWLFGIQGHTDADLLHANNNVTVTRLLTCPRKVAIGDNIPVEGVNLMGLNSVTWGTAIHEFCERHAPPGSYTEVEFPRPGQPHRPLFAGTDSEILVRGKVDYLSPDMSILLDYKCHSEASMSFKIRGVDADLAVQFSLYKRLIEAHVDGVEIKKGVVWHGALVTAGGKECPRCKRGGLPQWVSFEIPWMDDEAILAHRPSGGDTTIREIVAAYKRLHSRLAILKETMTTPENPTIPLVEVERAIQEETPLAGRMMFKGKMCSTYCEARSTCDRLEEILPEDGFF